MVNISSIPALARPGSKPKYPMTGRKKEDETIMQKAEKKSEQLLGKPKMGMKKKIKMPTSSQY